MEAKVIAINEKYREERFIAFSKAEAIWAETNLAVSTTLDEIIDLATEIYQKTNTLVHEAEALRKWTKIILSLTAILAGICVTAMLIVVLCKKLLRGRHAMRRIF